MSYSIGDRYLDHAGWTPPPDAKPEPKRTSIPDRGLNLLQRYSPVETGVEAVFLTGANLEQAAKVCGGKVGAVQVDYNQDEPALLVPTLDGVQKARAGTYLVKDENGRFSVWTQSAFEEKYKKIGRREDGILINNPRSGGAVEPKGWGLNSDAP